MQLCWYRDAEELARRTLQADPMAERPHRLLMSAYAGLGETERALKVYERCRRILADALGVDPSSLTKAVHLQILSGVRAPKPMSACSPAAASVVSLERSLARAGSAPGLHLVVLRGAAGSGRCEVMAAAADGISSLGWRVENLDLRLGTRPTLSTEGDTRPLLVTLPLVDELNWNRLTQTLDTLKDQGSVPVVVVAPINAEMLPDSVRSRQPVSTWSSTKWVRWTLHPWQSSPRSCWGAGCPEPSPSVFRPFRAGCSPAPWPPCKPGGERGGS